MGKACTNEDSIDELLETFWEVRERENLDRKSLEKELPPGGIDTLESLGMLHFEGKIPQLSETAEARARDVVRRHRLAERLFHDVLDLSDYERDACTFEHVISKDVEEALCTFLGHPPTCPHNKPIPKGACCSALSRKYTPLISNLNHMEVGTEATVAFLKTAHIDKLASMGLTPGSTVRILQKQPSIVIKVDETTLALDKDIVRGIFVRSV